jgi:hypothetical protein
MVNILASGLGPTGMVRGISMTRNMAKLFAGAGLAAVAAGCASAPDSYASRNPYEATAYTGAEPLYKADQVALLEAPRQYSRTGEALALVSYSGIEGARSAHRQYADVDAEALDGRCEQFVKISSTESLIDIANLCDVSVTTLIDHNPGIVNPYFVSAGQVVEIPGGVVQAAPLTTLAGPLADLYSAAPGDTLSQIAYKFNVSTTDILNANPNVTWSDITPGAKIAIPVTRPASNAQSISYAPTAPKEGWQGWTGGASGGVADTVSHGGVIAQKPYQLQPVRVGVNAGPATERVSIALDRTVISPGDAVRVTAQGLPPGEAVTIYAGERTNRMAPVATIYANDAGVASDSVVVPTASQNIGGVLLSATRDDSGETLYSGRIGVIKLKDPNKD